MPLRIASLFTDNMVLQQAMPVPIWGTAAPESHITVEFQGRLVSTTATQDSRWKLQLPPLAASDQPAELAVTAKAPDGQSERHTCKNVLVGEVWLCSGQSNMGWTLAQCGVPDQEIAAAKYPSIRFLTVPRNSIAEPQTEFEPTSWTACNPETAANFSAVAYYFGRELHQRLNVPIGLINSSWGGSTAEAWVSYEALLAEPALGDFCKPDKLPDGPPMLQPARMPARLFNGMVAPLVPYALRGIIWYQGEANANTGRARQYRLLFPTLIRDWRRCWGQEDLAFHFVQLPNWIAANETPVESQWALLREAQLMALALPHTGMAVAIDVGDPQNLHPPQKLDVGLRLAFSALHRTYHQKHVVPSGPLLRQAQREGSAFRLWFDHADGGLVCRGPVLKGFALAGADGIFTPADAHIEGETIVVSSATTPDPQAVRYAWAANPECNLYNGAGLPASPVRTDRD